MIKLWPVFSGGAAAELVDRVESVDPARDSSVDREVSPASMFLNSTDIVEGLVQS